MCCVIIWRGAAVEFTTVAFTYILLSIDYLKEMKMNDDVNLAIKMMDEQHESSDSKSPTKQKRKRKSALDPYRAEIIQRRLAGKTYRQIANFLISTYKIKTDHTLVYDFCKRCLSE